MCRSHLSNLSIQYKHFVGDAPYVFFFLKTHQGMKITTQSVLNERTQTKYELSEGENSGVDILGASGSHADT